MTSEENGKAPKSRPNRKREIEEAAQKPTAMKVNPPGIPIGLRSIKQWLVWKYVRKECRWTKIPFQAVDPKKPASSTDSRTWASFDDAMRAYENNDVDGIGFALDGYIGIDLDDVRNPENGVIEEWAREIVDNVDSYTDISPSGTGIKIIASGKLALRGDGTHKILGVEFFDCERYFALTGHTLPGKGTVEDRQAEVDRLHQTLFDTKNASLDSHRAGCP